MRLCSIVATAVLSASVIRGPVLAAGQTGTSQLHHNRDQAVAAFLQIHNDARAAVGVAPLQWSDKLAAYAQQWADSMAKSGRFEHRPNNHYGENLAGYYPSGGPDSGARMWLAEKKDYHDEKIDGHNYKKFGHYTQMVWRESTSVGYGTARMPTGMLVVVANYEPAGNMQGQHPYKR